MKSQTRRVLCLIAVLTTLLFSTGGFGVMASQPNVKADQPTAVEATLVDFAAANKDGGKQIYIVKFDDAPLATYKPVVSGVQLDVNSVDSVAYLDKLTANQDTFLADASAVVGRNLSYIHTYKYVYGGAAMELTAAEAAKLAGMSYVVDIQPNFTREIQTDSGPEWIGADSMWADGYKGEGLVIGVIDTGINPENPSFLATGEDGYTHIDPGTRYGTCDSGDTYYDATFPCNAKLLGAYDMTYDPTDITDVYNPYDVDGHGSHTSSTAGGNVVTATLDAPTTVISREISGVAPHAHIISYRACWDERVDPSGSCPGDALLAAINQAVADGVDAINYSIGGGARDPWNSSESGDALAFLDARTAGIFVATSAGNSGPDYGTMGSPAVAPWLTAVGNSTHNRAFLNSLVSMVSDEGAGPADMVGKSLTDAYGPAPIVYAGDYGDPLCAPGAFSAGTWTNGEIVVCDRGTYARVDKGQSVLDGGAGGYILANDSASGNALVADPHYLPALHITYNDGVTLKNWIATSTNPLATINGTYESLSAANGDIMASSSSRGVNEAVPDVIKPDVTAPGTDIFAAYGIDGDIEWNMISGTSMASPHVAGAGTLLAQAHPEWTPAEAQSALMLTGQNTMLKEDAATAADPFDMGGGRAQVEMASDVGFVLDVTTTEYEDADPDLGGDPKTLNLPSLGNSQCVGECVWTREISSTLGTTINWTVTTSDPALTVEPTSFALAPGATQTVVVTATTASLTLDQWTFGTVDFAPDDITVPDAHFTVAVMPTAGSVPDVAEIDTGRDAGSRLFEDLEVNSDSATVFGKEASISNDTVDQDPTNGDAYDDLSQVWYSTFSVPADALYLVAEILETTAPDIDLFVGYDLNSDGMPQSGEQIGSSTTAGSAEIVAMDGSELESIVGSTIYGAGGTYWVLVQNWTSSGATDPFTLAVAAVGSGDEITGASPASLEVDGVVSVDAAFPTTVGTPFDARVFFDLPDFTAWYGVAQFFDGPDYQLEMPIHILRGEDDVIRELIGMVDDGTTITATFGITVAANATGEDLSYLITDTLPAALSFVPGSATGGAIISGDTLTWTVDMTGDREYAMSTSLSDPLCMMPNAEFGTNGAYADSLELYGYAASSTAAGDTVFYSVNFGTAFEYFGEAQDSTVYVSDDGVVMHDAPTAAVWTNYPIPDPVNVPANFMAPLWWDMEIVTETVSNPEPNQGLTLVVAGDYAIVEIDDAIPFDTDGAVHVDYQSAFSFAPSDAAGAYEVIFAYDNIVTPANFVGATVGVEDSTGTLGTQYGYGDVAIADDMAVCFDWTGGSEKSITYMVTTTVTGLHDITLDSINDNPGAEEESSTGSYLFEFGPNAVSLFGFGKFGAFGLAAAIAVSAVVALVIVRKRKH